MVNVEKFTRFWQHNGFYTFARKLFFSTWVSFSIHSSLTTRMLSNAGKPCPENGLGPQTMVCMD